MKNILLGLALTASTFAQAQNPVIQTRYTADPAPLATKDRLYLYADVDEPHADFFWMYQWRVYSTTDMVNWTDHGEVIGLNTFSWDFPNDLSHRKNWRRNRKPWETRPCPI